jgi:hypothetical protein
VKAQVYFSLNEYEAANSLTKGKTVSQDNQARALYIKVITKEGIPHEQQSSNAAKAASLLVLPRF